ncbi:MAG: glutathione S-transferase family protein, partial [Pseudolabrys sp.]|nr:glutathione S-transferase family protein [Pseudolabrys sp.]
MIKIWGRNTSSNVQKVMWAVGALSLKVERIDVGGAFGKNKEAPYLAMNPNGLVPTLEEEDGFTLWESNTVVRYLAGKYDKNNVLEPKNPQERGRASQWMDWQLTVLGPAITPVFWGLIRTPPEKRDNAAIKTGQDKTIDAMKMLDAQLGKTPFVAGSSFSYGDIPVGV